MNTKGPYLAIAFLTVALGSGYAHADSIQAQIPFAFIVGDKVFPPATYLVEIAGETGPSVLTLRTLPTGERVMFDTKQMPEKANPEMTELVFDTIGDKTYLTEVWGVTDSGRGVKHLVDGRQLEPAPEASRQRVIAVRVVNGRTSGG